MVSKIPFWRLQLDLHMKKQCRMGIFCSIFFKFGAGTPLHGFLFWIHSPHKAFSAASSMFLVALLHCSSFTPRSLRVCCNEWPTKPWQPTLTGSQRTLKPLRWHSATSSAYFALMRSLASTIQFSQGTVSSSWITYFVGSEVNAMSGRGEVVALFSGNSSCLPRSL